MSNKKSAASSSKLSKAITRASAAAKAKVAAPAGKPQAKASIAASKATKPAHKVRDKVPATPSSVAVVAKQLVKKPEPVKGAPAKAPGAFASQVKYTPGTKVPESHAPIPKADPKLEQNLAKKPVGSLQSSLRLFQIYYEPWQRELLDPNFAALDNSKSDSELLEFAVFEKLAKSDYVKGAQLWGALSWRFTEKTGMSGADWVKNIVANPGADVYYCDPFPHNEALFHNLWLQGETTHPQFLALCQAIFQVTGLPVDELTSVTPSHEFSAANYFVGSAKFWSSYLPWIAQILSVANKKLPPKVRDLMHSKQADDRGLHNGASYVPFIVERLFPLFMRTVGKDLKGFKIALPERERELNVHLKLLREMKDVAHKTKSAWLVACWVNYRNLYLTQTNSKEWCNKHLRNITPADIKFSAIS